MKNIFRIGLIIIFINNLFIAQANNKNITIRLYSNSVEQNEQVFISGNFPQLGSWQPDTITLNLIEGHWEKTFTFKEDTQIEFKFTKGSWEKEALGSNGEIPPNNIVKILNDTTLIYHIDSWKNFISDSVENYQITGDFIYHRNMSFEGLISRDIVVWLPPNYFHETEKHYPVFYMHDGQNLFNPKTSFTGIDWQVDETADSLIKMNKIEPVIIVGIYNTKDRNDEYSLTSKGTKYMLFVIKKLKPFIDSTYRTLPDKENTAVGGSSLGGLISLMLAWNFSAYFSKAACFSPAFKYNDFNYTNVIEKHKGKKKDLVIYIDNGGKGVEKILQPDIDKMIEVLQNHNFRINEDLFIEIDSSAEHNEAAWAKRTHLPLQLFFPKQITKNEYESVEPIENIENNKRDIRSNRFRIQGTTVSTLQEDDFIVNLPALLNVNYRMSNIDSLALNKNFSVSLSLEPGVNIFFDEIMILPYIKFGPEFRFYKSLYFDFHLGGSLFIPLGFIPFYFYGSEIGYIFNQTENFSFEFELGFNGIHPFYLYYFALTFSF